MRTPLHEAAIDGDLGLALTRIHSEEDIDQTDQDGNTPLFLAVTNKNVDIVEALLEAGANPEMGNRHGNTERNGRASSITPTLRVCGRGAIRGSSWE